VGLRLSRAPRPFEAALRGIVVHYFAAHSPLISLFNEAVIAGKKRHSDLSHYGRFQFTEDATSQRLGAFGKEERASNCLCRSNADVSHVVVDQARQ